MTPSVSIMYLLYFIAVPCASEENMYFYVNVTNIFIVKFNILSLFSFIILLKTAILGTVND